MLCREIYNSLIISNGGNQEMNRVDFSEAIENMNDSDITKQFDEVMLLYDIVGDYENIKISNSSDEIASFDVTFESVEFADKLINECHGIIIHIHDTIIHIDCTRKTDNSVHVVFKK